MAFTPEEQAILCQLSYIDIQVDSKDPKTLEEILVQHEDHLREKLGDGYDDTLDGLMEKVAGEDYHIVKATNDDHDSGFVAIAIEDPNHDVTVVCRGSEDLSQVGKNPDSNKDLDTDIQIGVRQETDQQQAMEQFMDELEKEGYDSYYFTGHSLGGNLAIHGAVYLGDPDKVKGVTTYNAPGFNDKYWAIHRMRLQQIEGKVTNYENEYDIVSDIFTKPGKTVYVECNEDGKLNHSICDFKLGKKGFKQTDGKSGIRNPVVSGVTNGVIDLFWDASILHQYIYAKITGGTITGYRDFSQSALDTMINAAKETEEEAWWRVDRWDCWYRLDRAFGSPVMDFQRLTGNVDKYYRKVIDMNDASVADIKKIFQKVYDLDDTFAAKIQNGTSQLNSQVQMKLEILADSITPSIGSHRPRGGGGGGGRSF